MKIEEDEEVFNIKFTKTCDQDSIKKLFDQITNVLDKDSYYRVKIEISELSEETKYENNC